MNVSDILDEILSKYGHKVIYRRYHTGTKSTYYDPVTHEGVGGEKWTHTDSVIITRMSPSGSSQRGSRGEYDGRPVYYIKSKYKPKVNDVIIEVDVEDKSIQASDASILSAKHSHALRIQDIDPKRAENGSILFFQVYVEPDYGYY